MARDNSAAFLLALGGAIAFWFWSRGQTGQDLIGSAVDAIVSDVRGIRNNNPGNIRISSTAWQGMSPEQTDSVFVQFVSMDYGVRATAKLLLTYAQKYGLDTVAGIIARWAPASENDTSAYVMAVSSALGVDPSQSLDMSDPSTLFALVRAIIAHENGPAGLLVSDDAVTNGVALALAG